MAVRAASTGAALAALLLLTCPAPGATAAAAPTPRPGSAAQAQAEARAAAARVSDLTRRYEVAVGEVSRAATDLAAAFAVQAVAEDRSGADLHRLAAARIRQTAEVRAVYIDGGRLGLLTTVLTATSPDDVLWQASMAARVEHDLLLASARETAAATAQAEVSSADLESTQTANARLATALRRMQDRAAQADDILVQAKVELGRLTRQAGQLAAAEDAARRLAAAQAAAEAARLATAGRLGATAIPQAYQTAYRQAAGTCPGMDWTLLAAVGQVESGQGRNNGPSSAGAVGPMQFMPATFAQYGVDADGDGVADPWNYRDAIFTAARYLCVSGASAGTPDGIHRALLAYNHAEWYVDLVLAAQQAIRATLVG